MAETQRYLITTADERTWKFDQPVIFLGEWCCRYDRQHVWSTMDSIVAKPYGLGRVQKDEDHLAARSVEEELAHLVCEELNRIHGTNNSNRYWQIVLGHWLRRYVNVIFNRYHALKQCLENYSISGTTVLEVQNHALATPDSLSFVWACNDEIWNNILIARILDFLPNGSLTVETKSINPVHESSLSRIRSGISDRINLKKISYRLVQSLANLFVRDHDAFIINSYLPFYQEIKLQLSLGQIPNIIRHSPNPERHSASSNLRNKLALRVSDSDGKDFSACAKALLFDLLPTCYLEGFAALNSQAQQLPWPKQPRLIFTSNNFDYDEVFKCWTAGKIEQETLYLTGQHGSNYGTHRRTNPSIEENTADRFLTWGWTIGSKKQIPAFIFKTAGCKLQRWEPNGGLLLIELPPPHRLGPEDSYYEFGIYQEEQFQFVAELPEIIRRKLTVRLHSAHRSFDWFDEQRWEDRCPQTRIETGAANVRKLIAQNRLVVHSYDSTGILETLALNIPTLCFWQGGLGHLLDEAKPYYELLRGANILVDTPEQAAEVVSLHWGDIRGWWDSQKVQDARKAFCAQYARTENYPIRTLKRLLVTHADKKKSN
jgi:putative transferase (TIGR04331 family)